MLQTAPVESVEESVEKEGNVQEKFAPCRH